MIQVAQQLEISSLHITFPTRDEFARCGEIGMLQRIGEQFHWVNDGYEDFEEFLASLNSRRRKDIRKERRRALESDLTVRSLSGAALQPAHWDAFFRFYHNTSDRKWGYPYLTRSFFDLIGEKLADRVVLFMAEDDGGPVAGALNFRGYDTLYGRNWGCNHQHRFLHFETCYYQAIDYAIRHGLRHVEAGAQGPHKVHRGYRPVATFSAHWIGDPALRRAVGNFLEQEREAVAFEMAALSEHMPFRNGGDDRD